MFLVIIMIGVGLGGLKVLYCGLERLQVASPGSLGFLTAWWPRGIWNVYKAAQGSGRPKWNLLVHAKAGLDLA